LRDVGRHQLRAGVGHVQDVALQRAITALKNDQRVLQHAAPWADAALGIIGRLLRSRRDRQADREGGGGMCCKFHLTDPNLG
jgi:hypothetical protein